MKVSMEWLEATGAQYRPRAARSGLADLTHYNARYCEWGEGPPLVLVPGLAGGFDLLGPLARILASHYRVISYQLRGEDDCFALRRRFGLADLAGDLADFISWLGLESPALMGVSFGGVVALEYAVRHPRGLGSLVVQGAGSHLEASLLQQVAGMVLTRYPLPSDNPFVNQFFNLLFGSRQRPGPLFRFVTRQCWLTDQAVMAHRFRMVERFDLTGRLRQVRVPTLVLHGERDLLVSPRSLQALCEGIPDCRQVPLRGCGHLAFVTAPARVASEVREFLSCRQAVA